MEFSLYKHEEDAVRSQWVRFPSILLGLKDVSGQSVPHIELYPQLRKVFKDSDATTVNAALGCIAVNMADVGDPLTTEFPLINPITGQASGTMTVAQLIAAAYSVAIWLDQRNDAALAAAAAQA